MPGESMSMISTEIPLCFFAVRVGPHVAEALRGDRCVAGPHLLAADHESVAIRHGTGGQCRQVGSGVRLGHPHAPDRVAADRCRGHRLLRSIAELEQRRANDRVATEVHGAGNATTAHLFLEHERVERRRVAPTQLWRVGGHHPSVVEQRGLPVHRPLGQVAGLGADPVLATSRLGRRVGVEELHEVSPERLLCRSPSESHPDPPRLVPAVVRLPATDTSVRLDEPANRWYQNAEQCLQRLCKPRNHERFDSRVHADE